MTEHTSSILGPRTKESKTILGPRIPRKTQRETENIANYLVDKFNSPEYRKVFLKAAWRLSEKRIMEIVDQACRGNVGSPRAYFIASVKQEKEYGA